MTSVNTTQAEQRVMAHLGIRNAKLLSVYPTGADGSFRVYQANGRVFIVQVFPHSCGVEIFIPVSASLSLDTTLENLDEYIAGTH